MAIIKPVSYLRNNFADVSKIVHDQDEPVYLTKNGYGDMVVLSIERYEKILKDAEVYQKLLEAEKELQSKTPLLSHEEVFNEIQKKYKKND